MKKEKSGIPQAAIAMQVIDILKCTVQHVDDVFNEIRFILKGLKEYNVKEWNQTRCHEEFLDLKNIIPT